MPVISGSVAGSVDEGGLANGNDANAVTSATGSLGINFGADGPAPAAAIGPVFFSDQTHAQNNVTVHDASGALVTGLTSHGQTVSYALINSDTLVGYTGATAPTTIHDSSVVFSATLSTSGNGSYNFVLDKPIDHDGAGEDNYTFTFNYTAQDFDGDTSSGTFTVTDKDDAPVTVGSATTNLVVDEGGLTAATDTHGVGNDGGPTADSVSLSLDNLVKFGADGAGTPAFQLVGTDAAQTFLNTLGLTSHGETLTAAVQDGTLTASDAQGHAVFTLTVATDGTATFNLLEPLDHPPGGGTHSLPFDLSGFVQAVDFDGDAVTLAANQFTIQVQDDVPVTHGDVASNENLIVNGAFALGTFTPDPGYGGFAAPGNVPGWTIAASDVGGDQVQLERVFNGYLGVFMPDGDQMVDLEATPGNIQISQAVAGVVTGQSYALEFFAGASNPASSELDVFWGGQQIADIHPNGHETPYVFNVTGGAGDGSNILTFEEVGPNGDNTGTYLADVSLWGSAGAPVGIVDEGGLTSGTIGDRFGSGNDHGATTASGSLASIVSFGADGPAAVDTTATVASGGFQLDAANAQGVISNLHLMSHGDLVDVVSVNFGNGIATLTASTGGELGHEVFQLTLDESTGAWTFTLVNPLDDPAAGKDALLLDLSGLVKAVDFDGDVAPLQSGTFLVDVLDDVPVPASGAAELTGLVNEGGLSNGNELSLAASFTGASGSLDTLISFGADGKNATPFQFVSNASDVLAGLHISSHDAAVDFASVNGSTLTAYTGGSADGTAVFTLTLNSDDSWTFHLLAPIDNDGATGSASFDLSGLVKAVDFDGDSVGLASGGISITITDDTPTLVSATEPLATVSEGGLSVPGETTDHSVHIDAITGNDQGAATSAAGTLTGLVHFGADGAAAGGGFHLIAQNDTDATHEVAGLNLTSLGSSVDQATISGNTITAIAADGHDVFSLTVDANGDWSFNLLAPIDHFGTDTLDFSSFVKVTDGDGSSVPLSGDFQIAVTDDVPLVTGAAEVDSVDEHGLRSDENPTGGTQVTGGLLNIAWGADDGSAKHLTFAVDSQNNPIGPVDADGHALSLTSGGTALAYEIVQATGGTELVAYYKGSDPSNFSNTVFTLTLSTVDGQIDQGTHEVIPGYSFALFHPLDEPGAGANATALNFNISGFDFDGDLVAQTVTVDVKDDAPVAHQVSATMSETDASATVTLVDGTDYAFGADGAAATSAITFSTGTAHITGPAGETFGTVTYQINGNSIEIDPGTAFQQLGAGESATLDIPYTVVDFDGSTASSDILVTVTGVNQNPVFGNSASSATINEDLNVTGSGDIHTVTGGGHFTDVDYNDTHSASYLFVSAAWSGAGSSGSIPTSTFDDLQNALTLSLTDSTHGATGSVSATLNIVDKDLDFLANGETLQVTYDVTVTDNNGGSATKQVMATFDGSNDAPMFVSGGTTSGTIHEQDNVTGSGTFDTTSGVVHFTDADFNDTHTVTASYVSGSAVLSGGGSIPQPTMSDLINALSVFESGDSQHGATSSITWTASIVDQDLDFLNTGQTLSATFDITVSDGHASATEQVAVTFVGVNDAAVVSGDTSGTVTEAGGVNNGILNTPTASGTLTDADVDNTPNTFQAVTTPAATQYGNFTIDAGGHWTYSLDNSNATVQALNVNDKLTDSFTVLTQDGTAQTVTVTIDGANDAAVVSGDTSGTVTEAGGVNNGILNTPTASGTLTDADVDNTPNTFQAVTTPAATQYGSFTIDAGGHWTYNLDNSNATVQALNVNDKLTDSFKVLTQDGTAQTVTVTIDGANDNPVFAPGGTSGTVTEDAGITNGSDVHILTGGGHFTDVDVNDTHSATASLESGSVSWTGGSSASIPPQTMTDLINALSATVTADSTHGVTGTVSATLTIADKDLDFLGANDTLQATYDISVIDNHGGVATKQVVVTFDGANDAPIFSSADTTTGTISEQIGVTGSATFDTTSGVVHFTDADFNDTHSVTASLVSSSVSWSGGSSASIPIPTMTDLLHALSVAELNDSQHGATGSITWTASIGDSDLDFLATGETMSATYNISVSDGLTSATEAVTVTFAGANDTPAFASGGSTSGTVHEQTGVTGSPTSDTTSGVVHFTDADFGDTHAAAATYVSGSVSYLGGSTSSIPTQTMTDLIDAMSASVTTDSKNGATGDVTWSASITDKDLDFLGVNELVTAKYNLVVNDTHGGSISEQITVTYSGANDAPVITATDKAETTTFVAGGGGTDATSGTIHFTDADIHDQPTATVTNVTAVGGGGLTLTSAEIATLTSGTFHLAAEAGNTNNGAIDWSYSIPDGLLSFIGSGQTATMTETVTVSDGHGGTDTATVAVTIDGLTTPPPTATSVTVIENFQHNSTFDIPVASLLAGDSDPNATVTLTGASFADPDHQFISFTSPGSTSVPLTFGYTITDANGTSAPATVTIERVDQGNNFATFATNQSDFLIARDHSDLTLGATAGNDILVAGDSSTTTDNVGSGNDLFVAGNSGTYTLNGDASGSSTFVVGLTASTDIFNANGVFGNLAHTGHDVMEFLGPSDGSTHQFKGFVTGQDLIEVSKIGFNLTLAVGSDASSVFELSNSTAFINSHNQFHFDTSNNTLYYSANGGATEIALAQITSGHPAGTDIHVVA